jgi:lipoprotein-anchoring transpeptidase ErfK/SrfK
MGAINQQQDSERRPRRLVLAMGAALLVAAAAVGGVVLSWGRPAAGAHRPPLIRAPLSRAGSPHGAPTTTTTVPPDPNVSVVAYAAVPSLAVFPAPGGPSPSTQLANPNSEGAPLVLLVRARQAGWDQVQLPQRPNGATGWVRDADVKLYSDNMKVVVHLGAHTIDVYKEGQVIDHQPVIDGSPASPTPTGSFYITELLKAPDPSGPYGPYAFGLAAFSNTYTEFEGGPGQIAIHGTNQPWLMGQSASHGCVRLLNSALLPMVNEVPVGTPVEIDA